MERETRATGKKRSLWFLLARLKNAKMERLLCSLDRDYVYILYPVHLLNDCCLNNVSNIDSGLKTFAYRSSVE